MIRLEHVSKRFEAGGQTVEAVKDVSLHIEKGSIAGIIGFSGAGKSTLARCVNLLERPTEGRVIVGGSELTALSGRQLREKRKKIGMIFQHFNLFASRTVYGNVAYPLRGSGLSKADIREKVQRLLDLVEIGDKAGAYPQQLSGGQKQRVAVARALATDPKVLLCDEATSALDPTTTVSILELLKDLNAKLGVTVVVITHQMSVIEAICSRVAILDGGSVAELGPVQEIFSNPSTDAARRLVYPGGASVSQYPVGTRAARVSFNGGTVNQPLIASLAIDCGVKVSILGADTRSVGGRATGTMLLSLPDDPNEAAKALSYIRSQPYITVEEVEYRG